MTNLPETLDIAGRLRIHFTKRESTCKIRFRLWFSERLYDRYTLFLPH